MKMRGLSTTFVVSSGAREDRRHRSHWQFCVASPIAGRVNASASVSYGIGRRSGATQAARDRAD
jgi:hypothetical protein